MYKVERFACQGLRCFLVVALKSTLAYDITSMKVIILEISGQTIAR